MRSHQAYGVSYLRDGSALFVARSITQASVLLQTVVIARMLGPKALGEYAISFGIVGVAVASVGSGVAALVLRDFGTRTIRDGRSYMTYIFSTALLCLPGSAVAIAILKDRVAPLTIACALAFGALTAFLNVGSAFQLALNRGKTAALAEATSGFISAMLLLPLIAALGVAGAFLAGATGAIAGILVSRPDFRWPHVARLWPTARSATSFVGIGLTSGGYARVDVLVLAVVAGPESVGLYAAAYRLIGPFSLIASSLGSVFFRAAAETALHLPSSLRSHASGASVRLVGVFALLVIPGFLIAPALLAFLYGDSFRSASTAARILILSTIPLGLYLPYAHTLNASGRERNWLALLLVAICANAGLVAFLGSRGGHLGAATAWLLTELLLCAGTIFVTLRITAR